MHVKSLIVFAGWIPVRCKPSSSSTAATHVGALKNAKKKLLGSEIEEKEGVPPDAAAPNRQRSGSNNSATGAARVSSSAGSSARKRVLLDDDDLDEEDEDLQFSLIQNVGDLHFQNIMPHYHENIMHIRDPNYQFSPEARNSLSHLYSEKRKRRLREYGRLDDSSAYDKGSVKSSFGKGSVHVMSDGNSEIFIDDGVDRHLEVQSAKRQHMERKKEHFVSAKSREDDKDHGRKLSAMPDDEDYEVIEFADGSSIMRPVGTHDDRLQASNLVRNIWSAHNVRRLSAADQGKYANQTMSKHDWHSPPSHRRLGLGLAPGGRRIIDIENDYSIRHIDSSDPRYLRSENSLVEGHKRILQIPGGVQVDNSFTTLPYRHPQQCERKQCLSPTATNCKEHLRGFYLRERGCPDAGDGGTQTCTACQYATSLDTPTICQCEKILFTRPADYNQPCDSSRHCTSGECFRPCEYFLHVSQCPLSRCLWNTTSHSCVLLPQALVYERWAVMVANGTSPVESERGKKIVMMTPETIFPITYDGLTKMTEDYLIQGRKITDFINTVSLFQRLDKNYDGFITAGEFETLLTVTLVELENEALLQAQYALLPTSPNSPNNGLTEAMGANIGTSSTRSSVGNGGTNIGGGSRRMMERKDGNEDEHDGNSFKASDESSKEIPMTRLNPPDFTNRRLQSGGNVAAHQVQALSPDQCLKLTPPQFYCSISVKCITSCSQCGWKSVEDMEFYICVAPSAKSCAAVGKYYCGTDEKCVTNCANCVGRRILDSSQKTCLSPWWYEQPSNDVSTWVCRHRRKVGRSCIHDQDCIYGMRKCSTAEGISGGKQCLPLKPYEETHICSSHLDCPHINYYCPDDPTGNDKYWLKYCRRQLGEGRRCTSDVQCQVDMMCNTKEIPSPRCRKFFSLPLGHLTKDPLLCSTVWHNANFVCAYPAKSKNVGRPCTSYLNCQTTDPTGTFGECECKDWWDQGNSKYCMPVPGDYDNHLEKLRDLVEFQTTNCGKFWTDTECKEEFGERAINYFDQLHCEYNQLSKGPYLPKPECKLGDGGGRYLDACTSLKKPKKITGKEGAEGLNSGERKFAISLIVSVFAMVIV